MRLGIILALAFALACGCGGSSTSPQDGSGAAPAPADGFSPSSVGPNANECDALWRRFQAAFAAVTNPPPLERSYIVKRCMSADREVLACPNRCAEGPPGSPQIHALCMWLSARGCVQKHATARAAQQGVAVPLLDLVASGALRPDARGWVALPPELAHLSLDGRLWVGRRPDGVTLLFFKTWMGRQHNVAGYLYSSRPFSAQEILMGPDAENPALRRSTIKLDDFPLESPTGSVRVGATFNVVEQPNEHWVLIHWALD